MEMVVMKAELQDAEGMSEAIRKDRMFSQILTQCYFDTWYVTEEVFDEFPEIRDFYDDLDHLMDNMAFEFGGYEITLIKVCISDNLQ